MKTIGEIFSETFRTFCNEQFENSDYRDYCQSVRVNLEMAAAWVQDASEPLIRSAKWSWEKSGEHFGSTGQLVLSLLVLGILRNITSRKNKER